ncbi:MAG: hypothetical protein JJW00_06305 [Sulfurimonas sp.]|nr:hypothetical protein [Sulfurimonas sp.]
MEILKEFIKENTLTNTKEIESSLISMLCSKEDPIELSEKNLLDALKIDGEFLVLNLHYDDFQDELKSQTIKYKISQALSVIVRYEDDEKSSQDIENFIKYIYDISDDKQNSTFGIKKVDKLSNFPVTILFSGILPINQLRMTLGKKVGELIFRDEKYFKPRFKNFRDELSKELGIPILPVFPVVDASLQDNKICLVDLCDGRLISEFTSNNKFDKESIERYLLELLYIYKVLVEQKRSALL